MRKRKNGRTKFSCINDKSTKRQRIAGLIKKKKKDPIICCLLKTHLHSKEKNKLKVKGWKMILQANGTQKKVGVAILISRKNILQVKKLTRDKDGHYIMIKGTIHQEDLIVFHMLC